MSIASSSYKPKSLEQSSDIQDLKQQVRVLIEQNKNLTLQLEELIEVNNQLTNSIEEYSKLHEQKFGTIDQGQLEQLANQVIQLQKELQTQRQKTYQSNQKINLQPAQPNGRGGHSRQSSGEISQAVDFNIEQIFQVIKQLTNNIQYLQQLYPQQLQNMQKQLYRQREYSSQIFKQMQDKFQNFNELSRQLISQVHSKEEIIGNLNRQLSIQRNKKSQIQKQMKISFTIQDLKNTLEKKIQQKDQIIKAYQSLFYQFRTKFGQFTI